MTREDLNVLSTALAFVAVVTHGQAIKPGETTNKILELAAQIREFCELHAEPQS